MTDANTESYKVPYTISYTAKSGDRSLKSTTVRTYEVVPPLRCCPHPGDGPDSREYLYGHRRPS